MLPPLLLKEKTPNVGLSEQQNDTFHSSLKVRVICTVVLNPVRAQHINQTTSQKLPTVIKLATAAAISSSAHHSSLCRKNTSGPPRSRRRWSTRAVRRCVHQRCRSGTSSPCRQRETHRADHLSYRRRLELVHLCEDETHMNLLHSNDSAFNDFEL